MRKFIIVRLFCMFAVTASSVIGAEDPQVPVARELAREGLSAFQEGRFEQALEKSLEAYRRVAMPSLLVTAAEALENLERYTEALQRYQEAVALKALDEWPPPQHEAQERARQKAKMLLSQCARLNIQFGHGQPPEGTLVTIEPATTDAAVTQPKGIPSALRTNYLIKPGKYLLRCNREEAEGIGGSVEVTVKEDEEQTVQLVCGFSGRSAEIAPEPMPSTPPAVNTTGTSASSLGRGRLQLTLGIGALSVGLGGVVLALVEHSTAKTKRAELLATGLCSGDGLHCDPQVGSQVDSYKTTRAVSTAAIVCGSVLLVGGATILLWPPKREPARLGLVVGAGHFALHGMM